MTFGYLVLTGLGLIAVVWSVRTSSTPVPTPELPLTPADLIDFSFPLGHADVPPENIRERCLYGLFLQRSDPQGVTASSVLDIYDQGVAAGDALALVLRGDAFRLGYGGRIDRQMAMDCYTRAMAQGDPDGTYMVAWMLAGGGERPSNQTVIVSMVRANAERGHLLSRLWYAEMLEPRGKREEALRELQTAAESGSALAKIRLARRLVSKAGDMTTACRLMKEAAAQMDGGTKIVLKEFTATRDLIHDAAQVETDPSVAVWLDKCVEDLTFH